MILERTTAPVGPATVDDPLCPVAAGLDALGDSLSILLVRDLLWHGPQSAVRLGGRHRHVTRQEVVERLERLREHQLVERTPDRSIDPTYHLTRAGEAAEAVVGALYRFGLPVLRHEPLTPESIADLVTAAARDRLDDLVRMDLFGIVGLEVSGRRMSVVLAPGIMRADASVDAEVDVVCTHDTFAELVTGTLMIDDALRLGAIQIHGPERPVRALFDLLRIDRRP